MHNMRTRKPETESAVVWMEKHLEPDYVKKTVFKKSREDFKKRAFVRKTL